MVLLFWQPTQSFLEFIKHDGVGGNLLSLFMSCHFSLLFFGHKACLHHVLYFCLLLALVNIELLFGTLGSFDVFDFVAVKFC
jgi:hypothetical protein